jgi:hypothetical protein
LINEIKKIIENYLNNKKFSDLMIGTVTNTGIKISDKVTVPNDLIKGNLKGFTSPGDKVRLICSQGEKEYYIVEIIGFFPVLRGMTVNIEPITINDGMTLTGFKINGVMK